jgi:5-methylthioadenosine/S-adenosylhomocysteine deaminase
MNSAPIEADLLVKAGAVVTMNVDRQVIGDGAVAIRGGEIVAVGKTADLEGRVHADNVIELRDGFITPGLIDGHNHPQDSLLSGLLDDVDNAAGRMGTYVFPYEHAISDDEAYVTAQATFATMLRNGTTCFCDAGSPTPDGIARAATESGIRGIIARRSSDRPGFMRAPVEADADTLVERATAAVEAWDGTAGGRIRARYNLDLSANVSDELCAAIIGAARGRGVGIVGHLVGRVDPAGPKPEGRMVDVERYESLGVLGPDLLLAHIGWISDEDVAAFVEHDVKSVHCPSQSMFGATGVIGHGSIPELVKAQATVGLGTDAACISRFLDLVRVMYLAACAHKDARMDPLVMGAYQAFEMATIDGARALLWDDEIGSLEVGKRADLVVFEASDIAWYPDHLDNPVGDLVYSGTGRSAHTVIVDGRVVIDEGRHTTIDTDALAGEMDALRPAVFERLGFQAKRRWPVV